MFWSRESTNVCTVSSTVIPNSDFLCDKLPGKAYAYMKLHRGAIPESVFVTHCYEYIQCNMTNTKISNKLKLLQWQQWLGSSKEEFLPLCCSCTRQPMSFLTGQTVVAVRGCLVPMSQTYRTGVEQRGGDNAHLLKKGKWRWRLFSGQKEERSKCQCLYSLFLQVLLRWGLIQQPQITGNSSTKAPGRSSSS